MNTDSPAPRARRAFLGIDPQRLSVERLAAHPRGVPLNVAASIGFVGGTSVGLVDGMLVAKAGISSFLVTLSTQLIVRGMALYISHGFPQPTLDVHLWLQTPLVGTFDIGNI